MSAKTEPDLDAYLRRTASGELVWVLHGVIYEARDDGKTLTINAERSGMRGTESTVNVYAKKTDISK